MITEQQYIEAQEIVDAWRQQEYKKALKVAQEEFPIGTLVKNKSHEKYPIGSITGYFSMCEEVIFDIETVDGDTGIIPFKNAIKIDKL